MKTEFEIVYHSKKKHYNFWYHSKQHSKHSKLQRLWEDYTLVIDLLNRLPKVVATITCENILSKQLALCKMEINLLQTPTNSVFQRRPFQPRLLARIFEVVNFFQTQIQRKLAFENRTIRQIFSKFAIKTKFLQSTFNIFHILLVFPYFEKVNASCCDTSWDTKIQAQ